MKIYSNNTDQIAASRTSLISGITRFSAALILGSLAVQPLSAQTYERLQPKLPGDTGIVDAVEEVAVPTAGDESASEMSEARLNTVLLDELTGLVFIASKAELQSNGRADVQGVVADSSLEVLSSDAFMEKVASRYLSQPLTLRKLNALNRNTVDFLRKNGLPVVDVIVPEQDISAGSVQLIVLKGTVGQISFAGNEHFSSELLAGQIRSTPGSVVTGDTIADDLNWINRNPFRNVNLQYSRGNRFSETDLNFQVEDRKPIRYYVGYENSGTEQTDKNRFIGGLNWGNAFGLDHQLNYQYTMAPDTNDFYAHSANYVIPITQWRHILSFYGAYSNSTPEIESFDITSPLIEANGESYSLGMRYAVPLPSTANFNHEAYAGYDYKYSENQLTFGGFDLPKTKTLVSQFNLGYSAGLRDSWGSTTLNATVFYSPGDMFSYDNDKDYDAVSYKGNANYVYGRLSLERITRLPEDFSLLTTITGQTSNENLLSSEQLSAGGYSTVRGYNERVANSEEGIITTVELRTPTFSVLSSDYIRIAGKRVPSDQLQLLTFWDYANLERHDADDTSPTPKSYSLSSAGIGLRYSLSDNMSVRFDYGWQIKDSSVGDRWDSRGHIGVVISY